LLTAIVGLLTVGYGVFCLVTGHQDTSGSPVGGIIVGSVLAAGGFGIWWYDSAPLKTRTKKFLVNVTYAVAVAAIVVGCLELIHYGFNLAFADNYRTSQIGISLIVVSVGGVYPSLYGLGNLLEHARNRIQAASSKL
jgi:hypothetical protein